VSALVLLVHLVALATLSAAIEPPPTPSFFMAAAAHRSSAKPS
jgi:hypothetical protein